MEYILPKLSMACHTMRIIKPHISLDTLKIIYYSTFNSVMNYGIPFWGNSPHSKRIFVMQKWIVQIMMGCRRLASCRNLFKKLKILSLTSQYILSTIVNSEIHNINTRQHSNLHHPAPNLTGYKQGVYYSGVKIYNNLPPHIKHLSKSPRIFEQKLKDFLYYHSFYSLEEYYQYHDKTVHWNQ